MTWAREHVGASLDDVDVRDDGGAVVATARFGADLPVFAGHFPGWPIVPGVLWIEAVRQLAERGSGQSLVVAGLGDVRFLAPVGPGEEARLDVRLAPRADEPGGYAVRASVTVEESAVLRAVLDLRAADPDLPASA